MTRPDASPEPPSDARPDASSDAPSARAASRLAFIQANARWLLAGLLLALGSSVGQTFFISVFSASLREDIGLSHAEFGGLYMAATVASAFTLIQLGPLVDSRKPRMLAMVVIACLAGACLLMASAASVLMLFFAIYGLRLFGQGMISHLSQTLTARWFVATRGRALAVSNLGYPLGEAFAPMLAVAAIALIGWRGVWVGSAAIWLALLAPLMLWLLARDRIPEARPSDIGGVDRSAGVDGRHWSRGDVLRSRRFWLLAPGVMAPGFISTVVFFLPDVIAEAKGWSLATVTAHYPIHAACGVASSLVIGVLIDRFGARQIAPVATLPLALGLVALAQAETTLGLTLAFIGTGMTAGAFGTIQGALWAEMFGTAHLGAIKALAHAVMVLATALGPGVTGLALDSGASLQAVCLALAAYALAASLSFATARISAAERAAAL